MPHYAGVDLGATHLEVAVADEAGRILARRKRETPSGPDGSAVEDAIRERIESACERAGIAPDRLAAVGIATVGPLDPEAGTVEGPANLRNVERIRLHEPIADLVGDAPVRIVNDATAGVVGERAVAEPTPDDLVYLTISTGIGAGVCVDGNVLAGWRGNAGEVGHVVVDPEGRLTCDCGVDGHWEAYCSGAGIPRYARALAADEGLDTSLPLDETAVGAADVFAAAEADPLADRVIERLARWNAIGVATVVHAYDPAVVVIGGPVTIENPGAVVEPIVERVPELLLAEPPSIRGPSLGGDAVVRGALELAIADEPPIGGR